MKYQVVLLGTPWNQKELTHGVLSLPGLSLVELNELNMNRPFLCLYFGQSDKDSVLSNEVKGIANDIIKHNALLPITMFPDAFKTCIPNEFKAINGLSTRVARPAEP